eukprot:TRINITY_DN64038_c0_g1_i1.p1 TRINITY_DN64038_c0_g1~~TRINITY_DN64038_c0_g1_i1.p1  ORF type:complete len:663 (+),score=219.66 TRINITY_DN64038_c0_g1_i1:91-2079(+)
MKRALLIAGVAGVSASSDGPGNPVSKVFTLLKDLRDKTEKDGETDETNYEKYKCWCETMEKKTKEMIKDQGDEIEKKNDEIEEGESSVATLKQTIKKTEREIKENIEETKAGEKARAEAADKRAKDSANQKDTVADLTKAGKALDNGEGGDGSTDQILTMINTQVTDTAAEEKEEAGAEAKAVTAFNGWMKDMKAELGLLQKTLKESNEDAAETLEEIAEDTQVRDQTAAQKKADEDALAQNIKSCANAKTAYDNRVGMRTKEMAGLNKALEILTEKRALFDKTFKEVPGVSFLQLSSKSSVAQGASMALKSKAALAQSSRLRRLARRIERAESEGGFDKVLKSISDMLANLKTEAASDKKKKDFCNEEYQKVAKKSKNLRFKSDTNAATIDKLSTRLDEIAAETEVSQDELKKTRDELATSKKTREDGNKEFLAAKKMDQEAQKVLGDVLAELNKYYARDKSADPKNPSLLSVDPNELKKKRESISRSEHKYSLADNDENGQAASNILALIERIVDNLGTEIKDDQEAEAKAVEDWMAQTKALKKVESELVAKITNLGTMKTAAEGKKSDETDSKKSNDDALKAQTDYKAGIAKECDWMLAKFDERTTKRLAETEGLQRAKELLSGASFVQKSKKAADDQAAEAAVPGLLSNYLTGGDSDM